MYAVRQILASPKPGDFCEAGQAQHYIIYAAAICVMYPGKDARGSIPTASDREGRGVFQTMGIMWKRNRAIRKKPFGRQGLGIQVKQ